MTSNTGFDGCIVVRCPTKDDAAFASRWLASAHKADGMLARYRKRNPHFEEAIAPLLMWYDVEFSPTAMAFVSLWLKGNNAYVLDLSATDLNEPFAYMAEVGFFTWSGQDYCMSEPCKLTPKVIANALLRLADTKDEDDYVHPELLLKTMTSEDAHRSVSVLTHIEDFMESTARFGTSH